MHDIEMKVSQYSDDLTLFIGDLNNLIYAMKIIKSFGTKSGIVINNNNKTYMVKIGTLRGRSIPWQGKCGFDWTNFAWIDLFCFMLLSL